MLKSKLLIFFEISISGLLFLLCLQNAIGSKVYLFFFFLSSTFFFILNFNFRESYFLKYSSLILFLGFWVKFSIHTFLNTPFIEPSGGFDFSDNHFNELYIILATVFVGLSFVSSLSCGNKIKYHSYKIKYDFVFIVILLLSTIVFSCLNHVYGIQQAGLIPRTILLRPLNAVIYYLLSLSLALFLAFFIESFLSKKKFFFYLNIMPFYSLLCFSLLSRAHIVSTMCPIYFRFFFGYLQKKSIPFKSITLAILVSCSIFVTTFSIIHAERNIQFNKAIHNVDLGYSTVGKSFLFKVFTTFKGLVVDRWIGMEGLMVSIGHKNKGFQLFKNVIFEIQEKGKPLKNEFITGSSYHSLSSSSFNPMTILGPVSLFYLTNSLSLAVFFTALTFFIFYSVDILTKILFQNKTLSSICGFNLALSFSQISWAPINLVKYLVTFVLTLVLLKITLSILLRFKLVIADSSSSINNDVSLS